MVYKKRFSTPDLPREIKTRPENQEVKEKTTNKCNSRCNSFDLKEK